VESVGISAAVQDTPGEFVYDLHEAFLDYVLGILVEQLAGADRLGEVVDVLEILLVEQRALDEPALLERVLHRRQAVGRERYLLVLLFYLVVADERFALVFLRILAGRGILIHLDQVVAEANDLVDLIGVVLGRTGDDKRRARLVDEDGVYLVDDAVVMAALHAIGRLKRHIVAQVVETELVVGSVGDILRIGRAPRLVVHVRQDSPDGDAEIREYRAHPLGIALRQVVVDGDDMDALAFERVEVGRRDRRQGLALAGLHLDDLAVVEDDAA